MKPCCAEPLGGDSGELLLSVFSIQSALGIIIGRAAATREEETCLAVILALKEGKKQEISLFFGHR